MVKPKFMDEFLHFRSHGTDNAPCFSVQYQLNLATCLFKSGGFPNFRSIIRLLTNDLL